MLAAAKIAGNGHTILTPLPKSPVVDAGDDTFLDGANTAPQGTVDGLLLNDIAGSPRIADGDGNGTAQVDIGAIELVTPVTEAAYFVGGTGRFCWHGSGDVYRQTEDGASLFFDGSDVLRWSQTGGLDVIAADEILLLF